MGGVGAAGFDDAVEAAIFDAVAGTSTVDAAFFAGSGCRDKAVEVAISFGLDVLALAVWLGFRPNIALKSALPFFAPLCSCPSLLSSCNVSLASPTPSASSSSSSWRLRGGVGGPFRLGAGSIPNSP